MSIILKSSRELGLIGQACKLVAEVLAELKKKGCSGSNHRRVGRVGC